MSVKKCWSCRGEGTGTWCQVCKVKTMLVEDTTDAIAEYRTRITTIVTQLLHHIAPMTLIEIARGIEATQETVRAMIDGAIFVANEITARIDALPIEVLEHAPPVKMPVPGGGATR